MFVRKSFAGVLTATLAGAALAFAAAPAHADYVSDVDDSVASPVSADLIGVGSDTTQHAMKLIADAWNDDSTHTFRIATFAATEGQGQPQHAGATLPLPSGQVARPNGSGAGKTTLYNPSNPDIDFARSSDALSDTEANAGLKAFPFALDTLGVAVSGSTASHAPASLTVADLVKIYECQPGATNWSDFGGTAGAIAPKTPQSGSGTAKFFKKQLDAAKGSAVTYGACVDQTVQEHSDGPVKNDANAIAPFSKGRAGLLGGTVKVLGGFSADRALYNVVRSTDASKAEFQAVFGEEGFVCSAEAFQLIADAGFKQLATPAHGGACGTAVNSTTDFDLNAPVDTATTLKATAVKSGVTLIASVTNGATGTVQFAEGDQALGSATIVSGQATLKVPGASIGQHTYSATYVPDDSIYVPSSDDVKVAVKASAKVTESFPATVKKGKKATGTVTVVGDGAAATGSVKIVKGNKVLKTASLKNGKANFTLPKLAKGKNNLKAVYAGNAAVAGATKSFSITQK